VRASILYYIKKNLFSYFMNKKANFADSLCCKAVPIVHPSVHPSPISFFLFYSMFSVHAFPNLILHPTSNYVRGTISLQFVTRTWNAGTVLRNSKEERVRTQNSFIRVIRISESTRRKSGNTETGSILDGQCLDASLWRIKGNVSRGVELW